MTNDQIKKSLLYLAKQVDDLNDFRYERKDYEKGNFTEQAINHLINNHEPENESEDE